MPSRTVRIGLCLLLVVGFTSGCKRGPNLAAGSKAFEAAPPEVRANWETAVEASRTNGYVTAYATLLRVRRPTGLTPEQLRAATDLYNDVVERLSQALQRGDPAAKEAAQAISQIDKSER